jgi:hypothetical protein
MRNASKILFVLSILLFLGVLVSACVNLSSYFGQPADQIPVHMERMAIAVFIESMVRQIGWVVVSFASSATLYWLGERSVSQ